MKIHGEKVSKRPDIICKVLKLNLDQLMDELKKGKLFGKIDVGKLC